MVWQRRWSLCVVSRPDQQECTEITNQSGEIFDDGGRRRHVLGQNDIVSDITTSDDITASTVELEPPPATETSSRSDQSPGDKSRVAAKPVKRRTLAQEIRRRVIFWSITLVVYVLSLGPMYWTWFDAKYNEGSPWIAVIYEPLYIVSEWCPPLARLIDWYLRLWIF